MKVAIISDIHDNLANLEKFINWCLANQVEQIICCGDVTSIDTLDFLARKFRQQIYLVRGNMEIYDQDEIENITKVRVNINFLGRTAIIDLDNKKVGLCHEPFLIDEVNKLDKCDIIFNGHTHKPWIEVKNNIKIVNPGTLGGVFQKATFAVWDTDQDEPELKVLELI
jgi:putative phosphoesterase